MPGSNEPAGPATVPAPATQFAPQEAYFALRRGAITLRGGRQPISVG